MKIPIIIITYLIFFSYIQILEAKEGFGPGDQDWGYVTVRKGANIFWWLYYTTAQVKNYTDRPLIVWLQGGPGGASSCYGNFAELGPLDLDLNPRNHTWLKDVNVLFVDSPVGAGFSYVSKPSQYPSNNHQIAMDLIQLLKGFFKRLPKFKDVPLYIAGESYGGKVAAEFAFELHQAIKANTIKCNLKGVLLSSPSISPIDNVLNWAPYLYQFGLVDNSGYTAINKAAQKIKNLLNAKKYSDATYQMRITQKLAINITGHVDFYNILKRVPDYYKENFSRDDWSRLEENRKMARIMPQVAEKLGLSQKFYFINLDVYHNLAGDYFKGVTHIVEKLLNLKLKCYVLSGQLDLIIPTLGTQTWVNNLKWQGKSNYINAPRKPMVVNGIMEGYKKIYKNFGMFWIMRSGHMIPADNPTAMSYILENFIT